MIKSRFLATVALGTIASILSFAAQPAQAIVAAPVVSSAMVSNPDRLFRNERPPMLWAGQPNRITDCIYDGRCGTIAIDSEHGCG
jgi:hypothetical protein